MTAGHKKVRKADAWKVFRGLRIVVTAGPTVEDIDPVRFISNRSSGRMGVAVARAALKLGARVVLVHGPLRVRVPTHPRLRCKAVRSAEEMYQMVMREAPRADVLVMAAAVADFTPAAKAAQKIKKGRKTNFVLRLKRTKDILAAVGRLKRRPFTIGFAAETQDMLAEAHRKLREKNCDLICANDVSERGSGFESQTNRVTVIDREGRVEKWPKMSKPRVAAKLLRHAVSVLSQRV